MDKTDRSLRLSEAIENNDAEYLTMFDQGRTAAFDGVNEDHPDSQAWEDGFASGSETKERFGGEPPAPELPQDPGIKSKLYFEPHPLGGINVILFDLNGNKSTARIDIQDAAMAAATLQMWITTMFQTALMQAQQQTQSGIVLPGR